MATKREMMEGMPKQLRPGILSGEGVVEEPVEKVNEIEQNMEGAKGQLAPEEISQLEAYTDNATMLIFSEKSQPSILQELQSGKNPIENVARTANHVHEILSKGLAGTGEQMTDKTMFLGATHVVSELILLADAAGLYTLENKERLDAFQYTLLIYFKEGMETGRIDPVELQKELEPLMNEEQRAYGMMALERMDDISKTPPPSGQRWNNPKAPPQPQQAQPAAAAQPAGQVPPGLVAQGGM